MVTLPGPTAVTKPVAEFTVATRLLLLLQLPPMAPLLDKALVAPEQMVVVPLMVPADGIELIVIFAVDKALPQVPVTVYAIVAEPAATPVTTPVVASTVAAAILLLLQLPPPVPLLVNVAVLPAH